MDDKLIRTAFSLVIVVFCLMGMLMGAAAMLAAPGTLAELAVSAVVGVLVVSSVVCIIFIWRD